MALCSLFRRAKIQALASVQSSDLCGVTQGPSVLRLLWRERNLGLLHFAHGYPLLLPGRLHLFMSYLARIFSWFHLEYSVSPSSSLLSFKCENFCFGEKQTPLLASRVTSSFWANVYILCSSNYTTSNSPWSEPLNVHLKAFKNSPSIQSEVSVPGRIQDHRFTWDWSSVENRKAEVE